MPGDDDLVESIASHAKQRGWSVAVAESLTSGAVASSLGSGSDASMWFKGGVVAYDESVKFDVLGVTPGPVVTEACARQMAAGVRRLLAAEVSVALTGVGGPGPSEGRPPGTVHLAVAHPGGTDARELRLDGDPPAILAAAVTASLEELHAVLSAA